MSELEYFTGEIEIPERGKTKKKISDLECFSKGFLTSLLMLHAFPTLIRRGGIQIQQGIQIRHLEEIIKNVYLGGVVGASSYGLANLYFVVGKGSYSLPALAAATNVLSGIYEVARYIHKRYAPTRCGEIS